MMTYNEWKAKAEQTLQTQFPNYVDRLNWSREQVLASQLTRLRAIIQQAKLHSPWYRERFKDIDPQEVTLNDLHLIPSITKQELMDHWDDVVCDRAITKAKAARHQALLRDNKITDPLYKGKYLFLSTGGSILI